jgi:phosphate transport system permease protein
MSRLLERAIPAFARACGAILLAAIGSVIGYVFLKGLHTVGLTLIFGDTDPVAALLMKRQVFDGLFPAMVGTLLLVVLSVGLAVPLGVSAGVYLAEYAGGRARNLFNVLFDILAGLPSSVIGLAGFSLAVFLNRHLSERLHPSLLVSSVALAFLVLPYIIRTTQVSLENLPSQSRMTALALGANRLQNVFRVLLPQSLPGLLSGIILAIGRCAEDTAVIMLTGVVASAGVPRSLLSRYEALPFYIYYVSSQYADQRELATGYGASILLLVICLLLFGLAFVVRKGVTYRALYRA